MSLIWLDDLSSREEFLEHFNHELEARVRSTGDEKNQLSQDLAQSQETLLRAGVSAQSIANHRQGALERAREKRKPPPPPPPPSSSSSSSAAAAALRPLCNQAAPGLRRTEPHSAQLSDKAPWKKRSANYPPDLPRYFSCTLRTHHKLDFNRFRLRAILGIISISRTSRISLDGASDPSFSSSCLGHLRPGGRDPRVKARAVQRTGRLSRLHKCPVRQRGSRLGSRMSAWVQLVLLAACLRFGVAEGEPLPAALVELVRNSPISSIEDLQLLLLSDSVDEEDGTSAVSGGHRLPRSLDAQPAQQALCKVRTEVVEVTRAMLDRSNANFMLWPPCVEVQRCSGCCNTKSLHCVPVVTHTRYLQVMKIEYINKRPTYTKAVVSVLDHVECRCQPAPRAPAPRKKSSRRQHSHQHRNQTLGQEHGQAKTQSKDELHQWDELKQNQRARLEELLEQHWSPRGDTFTQPGEGYSLAGDDTSRSAGEAVLLVPHWTHNSSRLHGTEENPENVDGNKTVSSVDNVGVESNSARPREPIARDVGTDCGRRRSQIRSLESWRGGETTTLQRKRGYCRLKRQNWRRRGKSFFSSTGASSANNDTETRDDNVYDHTTALRSSGPQTSSSSQPHEEEDEEESQTHQQGSYESDANVELQSTQGHSVNLVYFVDNPELPVAPEVLRTLDD
ncbi:unnamed protein product [Pleuronectes platessa]|uniref:Platelet-derived growth factor subunit B n=1 Tax=Pleuronectes platessa TaxID=8262 RepID=A0A9N7UHG5_PLEPL|nr:unnamed protein product [Pleuronectes platessa]